MKSFAIKQRLFEDLGLTHMNINFACSGIRK
jgi:hypothetical protein